MYEPSPSDRSLIAAELERLTIRERAISRRRRRLHEQIDEIYLSAPINAEQTAALDFLEERERKVSAKRSRLHTEIDELRLLIGLPSWCQRHDELEGAA